MDFAHLPVIDWELATKLAGNKIEIAEEILDLLLRDLRRDTDFILLSYKQHNYPELLRRVHKLHGAICYCGLPRLKTLIAKLETQLKNNIMDGLPNLLKNLESEVNLLLERSSLTS